MKNFRLVFKLGLLLFLFSISISALANPINQNDSLKLRNFLSQADNARKLGVNNLDSLKFCEGVVWSLDSNSEYRISSIAWHNKKLEGDLDLEEVFFLISLDCSYNQISSLSLSGMPNFNSLDCADNQLDSLDLTNMANLISLNCSSNRLAALNIEGSRRLESLNGQLNQLSSLDILSQDSLKTLYCNNNNFLFSSLSPIITKFRKANYAPQNPVILEVQDKENGLCLDIDEHNEIDLSREVSPLYSLTNFIWTLTRSGLTIPIEFAQSSPGIFIMDNKILQNEDLLQLTMSNNDFPDFAPSAACNRSQYLSTLNFPIKSRKSTALESSNSTAKELSIYPNPARSHINIIVSGDYQWTIYNGQAYVFQQGSGSGNTRIDLELKQGMYFIKITKKGQEPQVRKFLVFK